MTPLVASCPDYATEPVMWDAPFRQQLLDGLVELGYAVEHAFDGTPQVRLAALHVAVHTMYMCGVRPHVVVAALLHAVCRATCMVCRPVEYGADGTPQVWPSWLCWCSV